MCVCLCFFTPPPGLLGVFVLTVRVNHVEGRAVLGEADCEESARGCQQQQQRQQLTEQKRRSLAHGCSHTTLPVSHRWRCYLETPKKKNHAFCYFYKEYLFPPAARCAREQQKCSVVGNLNTQWALWRASAQRRARGISPPPPDICCQREGQPKRMAGGSVSVLDAAEGRSVGTRAAACAPKPWFRSAWISPGQPH